mgnify:CR=1 FL=1|jgi:hypothetical protein|tara:strand:- start:1009 stop:1917 length:909 start_codon:yes stop_codon:yes gene_type:complete
MAYGKIKADAIVYDNNGTDAEGTLQNLVNAANAVTNKADLASPAFTGTPTAPTASAGTNSTQIATTAYADNAASVAAAGVVSSAPGTLDTLNELAAALGDDANFSTTVTNSIATKLPLAGGTLTGDLVLAGDPDANLKAATKQYVDNNAGIGASGGTFTGDVIFNEIIKINGAKEHVDLKAGIAASGTQNFSFKDEAIRYYTGNTTSDYTPNLRGDGSTTLNSLMSTGEALTCVYIVTYGSTAYKLAGVQIDGSTSGVTVRYVGGAPSSAGTANSICASTITVIKTADATFTVLVSQAEYEA